MAFDTGDTAFMLVATALVLIMTPGLAFFYGGLVGQRSVLTIMMQVFISLAVTTVLWVVVGYSISFGSDLGGVIGNPGDFFLLRGIGPGDLLPGFSFPVYVFVAYQLMFAVITPALITGAFAGRVSFKAYLMFLVGWNLFVYFPFAHMIWGGGWLAQLGVLDFAGGIVVHAIAGVAALASVFFIGERRVAEREPHNVPFVLLGTALLWFGWFGFNAGSALGVSAVTSVAFLNTQLGAAFGGLTWLFLSWRFERKPSVVGFCIGVIAGLAAITPAAGFVTPESAMAIGILAGVICYGAVVFRKRKRWDDALDVWAVHGVGGIFGALAVGLVATTNINPAGADGLFYSASDFFARQLAAVALAVAWAFVVTLGLLWGINKITRVRISHEDEQAGIDGALHGEAAYLE